MAVASAGPAAALDPAAEPVPSHTFMVEAGDMVLPASTRSVDPRSSPMRRLATPLSKMPFSHPRVFRRHGERLTDRLWRCAGWVRVQGQGSGFRLGFWVQG